MAALTAEQKVNERLKKLTRDTKHALSDAGISQAEVGDLAGINQSAVSNQFRRGQITLSVYLAAQLLLEEKH